MLCTSIRVCAATVYSRVPRQSVAGTVLGAVVLSTAARGGDAGSIAMTRRRDWRVPGRRLSASA